MENDPIQLKAERVTIYLLGEFLSTVQKIECTKWDVRRVKYAQYNDAVRTTFVQKGKRKAYQKTDGYRPFVLVLEGWGHLDPESGFTTIQAGSGVTASQSKYLAHSDGYAKDFNAQIAAHIEKTGAKVLADHREKNQEQEVA